MAMNSDYEFKKAVGTSCPSHLANFESKESYRERRNLLLSKVEVGDMGVPSKPRQPRSPRLFGKRPFDTQYRHYFVDPSSEAEQLKEMLERKNQFYVQSRGIGKYFKTR